LKKLRLAVCLCVPLFLGVAAQGQQLDIAFGAGTVSSAESTFSASSFEQSLRGGTYLAFSGDALIKGNFGVQGEVAWRASQSRYQGVLPYRPLFWDFNAIYAPRFNKYVGAEAMAGIGAESIRFYTGPNYSYFGGYTNYTATSHFMGDFGGGLKLYPAGNFFVRPEVRLYLVNNNEFFSSGRVVRYGMSIGYTFGGKEF
jgi:hypothetical protein